MAFVADDPNQQDPNAKPGQAPTDPTLVGGTGGTIQGGGATASQGAGASPAGTSSGSFVNLQNYVTANKGNDAQLGGAVSSNAAGKASQADTAGAGFQARGQQAVQDNVVTDPGNVVGALNQWGAGTGAGPVDQNAFNTEYNASYKGPKSATDIQGYGDTKGAYDTVSKYGNLATGDSADRGQLLSDVYAKGGRQYNNGERNLDSFILGSGQQGTAALNDISAKYGNYGTNFDKISSTIGAAADQGAKTTDATRNAVQGAAKSAQTGIEGRFNDAQGRASADNTAGNKFVASVAARDPNALQSANVGVSDNGLKYIKAANGNTAPLVSYNAETAGNFVNPTDTTAYSQLRSLIGGAGGQFTPAYAEAQLAKGGNGLNYNHSLINAINTGGDALNSGTTAASIANTQGTGAYNRLRNDIDAIGPTAYGSAAFDHSFVGQISNKLGVPADQIQTAIADGIDLTPLLSATGPRNLGDSLTPDQRTALESSNKTLGWSGIDTTASGNGASGYTFDTPQLTKLITDWTAAHPAPAPVAAPPPYVNPRTTAQNPLSPLDNTPLDPQHTWNIPLSGGGWVPAPEWKP